MQEYEDDFHYYDSEQDAEVYDYAPIDFTARIKQALIDIEDYISGLTVKHYREMGFNVPDGVVMLDYNVEPVYYESHSWQSDCVEHVLARVDRTATIQCIQGSVAEKFLTANVLSDEPVCLEKYQLPGKYRISQPEILSQDIYGTVVAFYAWRLY